MKGERTQQNWQRGEVEQALIGRASSGDRHAFDSLLDAHTVPLRGFLKRRVTPESVDDVVQETLLAAWSGLPHFTPLAAFKTWLYSIARNKAADFLRSDLRRHRWETPLTEEMAETLATDVGKQMEQTAMWQMLLAELPEDKQVLLRLYYTEGLSLQEIATRQNRGLSAVKYHFYQAHTALRQKWQSPIDDTTAMRPSKIADREIESTE